MPTKVENLITVFPRLWRGRLPAWNTISERRMTLLTYVVYLVCTDSARTLIASQVSRYRAGCAQVF